MMLAVEHESASILPIITLTYFGHTLQLTVISRGNLFGSFSLCTCEQNDLNTPHMFFQRRGGLILALCGLYNRIGMHFGSFRRAVAWVFFG